MVPIEHRQLTKRFMSAAKYCSLSVMGISIIALTGWMFDISAFKTVLPGLQTMKANIAFAFFVAGTALWFSSRQNTQPVTLQIVQICNGVVLLIGSLTLSEYIFRLDLGIDQLLFRDLQTSPGSFPGRMAFASALCLSLIGTASLLIHTGGGKFIDLGQYLAVPVLAVSLLALVGYIYDVQALYKLDQLSSMALHTAAAFSLLAIGTLSVRPDRGWMSLISKQTAGGAILRRLLPFVLGAPIFIGWVVVLGDRLSLYETHFGLALVSVLTAGFLVIILWLVSRQINRIDTDRKQAEEQIVYQANLLANVNDAIIATDGNFRLTAWNNAAETLYGWKAEDVLGQIATEILQTEFPGEDASMMRQKISEAGNWRGEATQLRKDGTRIPVEISSIVLRNSEGQISGYLSVNRDITERKLMEAAALESEARYRHVLDSMLEGGQIISSNWRYLYVNNTATLHGRQPRENLLGRTMMEVYPGIENTDLFAVLQHCMYARTPHQMENEFHYPDGKTGWFELSIQPVPEGLFILSNDITDRKRAENELRMLNMKLEQRVAERTTELKKVNEQLQSELSQREQLSEALITERDLLQTLMDNIPDTIYFKDTASRFTRINRAQVRVLGVDAPEDAIGKTDADFFEAKELAKGFYDEEQQIIKTGDALTNRIEFNPTPNGQPRWFSATKVPIKDENGQITGIVGISRDITQQKLSEEALRRSEERFRLMSWATKDALWDWDLSTNLIWWGEGLQKMFRYPSETQQTDPEWQHAHIHPQDRDKVNRSMNQALQGGMEFWSKEYRFQRFDGTYADIMDRGYIRRDEKGEPYRMIGAMMDITERKQAEATILHQNEMLSSLHQITLDLLSYREISPLLDALVELAAKFMDASYAEIMLVDEETLIVRAATQNQHHLIGERVGRAEALLSWQAVDTREPAVLSDYQQWTHRRAVYDGLQLHAVADFPILNDNQCLGVLALGREKQGYEFNLDQIQYGRLFANLAALVLNNAQLREALREQSIRDGLTGLYNRRYMEEALKQQLSRATRQLRPLGIIMLDIDHFKGINDTCGHAMGDALLRELGQLLKNHIRNEDIACRYGGEEFLLIMPDASLETAYQRAELLRQSAKGLRVQEMDQLLEGVTLSLGVAIYPQHGRTKDSVLSAADAALYRSKQEGRDRVVAAETA